MKSVISAVAYAKILHHSLRQNTEVIGLLVGKITSAGTLEISDVYTGPQTGTQASAILDHNVQAQLAERLHAKGKKYIIGWYHSHPNLGVFMSGTDITTQSAYQVLFPEAVALVIDPVRYVATRDPLSVDVKLFQVRDGYAKETKWELEDKDKVRGVMSRLEKDRRWQRQIVTARARIRAGLFGTVALILGFGILLSALIFVLLLLSGLVKPLAVESGIEIQSFKGDYLFGFVFTVAMLLIVVAIGKFFVNFGAEHRVLKPVNTEHETE